MTTEAEQVSYIAEFTVGNKQEKVDLSDISMEKCSAQVHFTVRPYQLGVLQLHSYQNGACVSSFKPINVIAESIKQKVGGSGASQVTLKFKGMVGANHGLVQFLHAQKARLNTVVTPKIESNNNSLRLEKVSCFLCGEGNIIFRSLYGRTMTTKTNIFGVPEYLEAYPGKDFCDFNLIRVVACPKCYFASNDISEFRRHDNEGSVRLPRFDAQSISKHWMSGISERKKLVSHNWSEFFTEQRPLQQAIVSYELAIVSGDAIFKSSEGKSARLRNYNPVRKVVFYLFILAELLMLTGKKEKAVEKIEDALKRLETVFMYLEHEPSIRAAYLLGMLNLYFEDYRKVSQYLTFLREYNKEGVVKEESDEEKTLNSNLKRLDDAFQNREEYSRYKLDAFKRPF